MSLFRKQLACDIRIFWRYPQGVFWNFFFPVFLVLAFGFVFSGTDNISFSLGLVDRDNSDASRQLTTLLRRVPVFKVQTGTAGNLMARLRSNKLRMLVEIPKGYGARLGSTNTRLRLWYDPGQLQVSQIALSVFRQVLDRVNWRLVGKDPPVGFTENHVNVAGSRTRYIDFLVPGILGMSLMSTCLFSIGMVIVSYREKGFLRRLAVTPLPKTVYVASQIVNRSIVVLIQAGLLLLTSFLVFDTRMQGPPLAFLVVLLLGLFTFISIGFFVASVSKTTETAAGISNIIFFPMMFLSGVYFPVDGVPAFLKPLVEFLPLTHLNRAIRAVYNKGVGLEAVLPQLGILAAWLVLAFFISVKRFRWE